MNDYFAQEIDITKDKSYICLTKKQENAQEKIIPTLYFKSSSAFTQTANKRILYGDNI
jgi:hypothetical protein